MEYIDVVFSTAYYHPFKETFLMSLFESGMRYVTYMEAQKEYSS